FAGFLRQQGIDVVNYHHSSFAADRAKSEGAATVYTMHNCYLWMDETARGEVARAVTGMDRVIAVSTQVAEVAAAQFEVAADRIVVVPNGLPPRIIDVAEAAARDWESSFTVCMVASLTRLKLQHVAIAAFAEVAAEIPEMRLKLIGTPLDGDYHRELKALIAA